MKKYIFLFISLYVAFEVTAQADYKALLSQANKMAEAIVKEDYATLTRYTYPKIVELMGGAEKMISIIEAGSAQMKEQGVSFESVSVGDPGETVVAGDELHCIVPQTTFLKVPKGKLKVESSLLAVSRDNGKNWFFIDAANLTPDKVKMVLPNFNTALILPGKKEPVFIAD